MQYENPWSYDGNELLEVDSHWVGFVYEIERLRDGRKYIGKKLFWRKVTRPPLKGKKRKRRSLVESDWRTYYGSNEELARDVASEGAEGFRRTILRLCKTRGECTYYELKEQLARDVLLRPEYYNTWIAGKCRRNHL